MPRFFAFIMVMLCLMAAGCTSNEATPAPASQAPQTLQVPNSAPAAIPTYPQVTVAAAAPGAQATEPVAVRTVRLKVVQTYPQAKSFVDFPLLAPAPSALTSDMSFLQAALVVAQRVGGDISTPIPVGVPVVEFLFRGGSDTIIMNQAKGTVDDVLWRFPRIKSGGREPVTVRGKQGSIVPVEKGDDTLYWEEDGRIIVMGGRIDNDKLLKAAEGLQPLP